jgi:Rod binding domain-containing protein
MNPLGPISAGFNADAVRGAEESQKPDTARQKADAAIDKAASEFEAIFVRKVLGDMQKATKVSGQKKVAGSEMYDSIWLNEVSATLAKGGGFGVGRMVKEMVAKQGKSPEEALATMKNALRANEHEELESRARTSKVSAAGAVPSLGEGFARVK